MKFTQRYKNWMILPALVWLFTQFAMSGAMALSASTTTQATLCTPFGQQQITIDLKTGEPVKHIPAQSCDWCQSFGVAVDVMPVTDAVAHYIVWSRHIKPVVKPINIASLWHASGFQSRAPPL